MRGQKAGCPQMAAFLAAPGVTYTGRCDEGAC